MNSIRERVLQEVFTRVSRAIAPVALLRMPCPPARAEESPAVLMFVQSDSISGYANHLVERQLCVRMVVVARGEQAFDVADQTLVVLHRALFADPNLGGLCIAIRELDCEWEFDEVDSSALAMPTRYEIRYRTHAIDLSQTG